MITDKIRKGDCVLQATVVGARNNLCPKYSNLKHGKRKAGRPNLTYIDLLKQDTGLEEPDIKTAMLDRSVWHWQAIKVQANVST